MDAHAILGVTEGASPEEIKRAYRRLAMRWHPDRNADPHAVERFKEIRAAYDLLSTVEEPVVETSDGDVADDNDTPTPDQPRAGDIRLNLSIGLEEAAAGGIKAVHFSRSTSCETCDGSGEAGMARTRFCEVCHGSGRVRDAQRTLVSCDACAGRGFFSERICPDCDGVGRHVTEVSLEVNVPAGMLTGDELRLTGQGEPGDGTVLPGDLYLTMIIQAHALFDLQGRDLHFTCPVSALTLMAGGEICLPTLGEEVVWLLEPMSIEPCDLRLKGKGYPGRGRYPAGDLVVRLMPKIPQGLSKKQRKVLLDLDAALHLDLESNFPEIAAWRDRHQLS